MDVYRTFVAPSKAKAAILVQVRRVYPTLGLVAKQFERYGIRDLERQRPASSTRFIGVGAEYLGSGSLEGIG
jgi:hypothetical protein